MRKRLVRVENCSCVRRRLYMRVPVPTQLSTGWLCGCHFNGLNFSQKSPRRGRYACPLCISVGFGVEIVSSPSVCTPTEQSIMNHPCAVCCGGRAVAGDSRTPKNCFYRFVKRFQHLPFSFASLSQLFDVLAYTYTDAHRIAQNAHVHT